MIYRLLLAGAVLCALFTNAEARQRREVAEGCNILWPCADVTTSARGERVVRAMGGFGSARQVYTPRRTEPHRRTRLARHSAIYGSQIIAHPEGCPRTAFCACGAAVRVFGRPVRELWLAANWYKFPRATPSAGMVAVRRHHVFVLEADLGGGVWQVFDANAGRHLTLMHARSIAGYAIVNPHAG